MYTEEYFSNLDIMPSHIDLVAAEIELVDKERREYMLKEALKEIKMIMITLLSTVLRVLDLLRSTH